MSAELETSSSKEEKLLPIDHAAPLFVSEVVPSTVRYRNPSRMLSNRYNTTVE